MNDPLGALAPRLAALRAQGRYRRPRLRDGAPGAEVVVDGRRLLAFASNDYLGLADHPEVRAAFVRATEETGVGAGAAHLLGGHTRHHQRLEAALAEFVGQPRALLFSTGYMANLGVVSAFAGRGDTVLEDRLDHASLIDGARLSGARLRRYRHGDVEHLERLLATAAGTPLVATDGVFSMDGDLAPLDRILPLARRHSAWLLVDEAHALGVVGPEGRGSLAHFGLDADGVLIMGTLGKALGTFGAFVAGPEAAVEWLVQAARSYIFTTALPPAVAAAAHTALEIARRDEERRERLRELVARFRRGAAQLGLPLMPSETPIQPLLVGDDDRAVALSRALEAAGIWVPPVRPPAVPEGQARLRITFNAHHRPAHVDRLLAALEAAWPCA